jgi:hypothetical protein
LIACTQKAISEQVLSRNSQAQVYAPALTPMNVNPALAPIAVLAISFFFAGAALERRYPRAALVFGAILAMPGLLAVLYYAHLFDRWPWFYEARSLPFSELTFSGLGFLGGTLYRWHGPETWKQRLAVPFVTAVILLVPFMKPLIDPLDVNTLKDRCNGTVCLQSSFATCGPASAATILRVFGQRVTERDLAVESFTYRGGTEVWYLARALRRRGNLAEFVFSDNTLPYPAVAGVRLRGGAGHFIAVLSATSQTVTVADPLSGEVTLALKDLQKMYQFTGFFLKIAPRRS